MRRGILPAALGAALVLLPAAFAEDSPQRVTLRGENLGTLELQISTEGIDDGDAASVARATAEVDAELDARMELQYALILTCELGRGFSSIVESRLLQKEAAGEDLADLRKQIADLARARVKVYLGKAEAGGPNRVLIPTIVTLTDGSAELAKFYYRILLQNPSASCWRVVRTEEPCAACSGLGRAADGVCTVCAGRGWVDRPNHLLPDKLEPPGPDFAIQRNDPRRAALSFLRRRVLLSRQVLAGFASAVGPVQRAFCRRIFTPAAMADLKAEIPAGGEIQYEAGDADDEGDTTVVAMLETTVPRIGKEIRTVFYVHVCGDPDHGYRVISYGPACPACHGTSHCSLCGGTGFTKHVRCEACDATGTCVGCDGQRIVPCELLAPRY